MPPIISINGLSKTYATGHVALRDVSLEIEEGEIIALLGPNGAGKTTLISIICGLVTPSSGSVQVAGNDIVTGYRQTRALIGLVPQEITVEPFETVESAVKFSRGIFGKAANPAHIEKVLRSMTLWDKRKEQILTLSGGMKRRLLIAKALSHEPRVLFLDEPTAGVDVELRKDMWQLVRELRDDGVTIILTTHYIEEAEAIADRVGVIDRGELLLVENKDALMQKMGKKQMQIKLQSPTDRIPASMSKYGLTRSHDGLVLTYSYDTTGERTGISQLLNDLNKAGLRLRDVQTSQTSLEEIFVDLVGPKS